jgi:hypothetical protein
MIRRNEMSVGEALRKLARHLFKVSFHSRGHSTGYQEVKM